MRIAHDVRSADARIVVGSRDSRARLNRSERIGQRTTSVAGVRILRETYTGHA